MHAVYACCGIEIVGYNFVIFLTMICRTFSSDCYELEYLQKCMSRTSSNFQSRHSPCTLVFSNNFKAQDTKEPEKY